MDIFVALVLLRRRSSSSPWSHRSADCFVRGLRGIEAITHCVLIIKSDCFCHKWGDTSPHPLTPALAQSHPPSFAHSHLAYCHGSIHTHRYGNSYIHTWPWTRSCYLHIKCYISVIAQRNLKFRQCCASLDSSVTHSAHISTAIETNPSV